MKNKNKLLGFVALKTSFFRFVTIGLLLSFSVASFAQHTLKGVVTDQNSGEPLIGVSVLLKNTTIGTATDVDGSYMLKLTEPHDKYVIVFSYLGYTPVEKTLTESELDQPLDVALSEDVIGLSEVVVTGASELTSKKQYGNAISTVNEQQISRSGSTAIDKALAGKVAGALISQNSGNPAGGVSVTLRGYSTVVGNSNPLYIVDGVIIDNSSSELIDLGGYAQNRLVDINPDDIDRIEIIKGASAAAIYGSRASNGVVQIFTKRGKAGKPRISFGTSVNWNSLRKEIEENMEPFKWAVPGNPDSTRLIPTKRYKMQDYIFHTGMGTNNNLSVSGGNSKTKYYASIGYLKNEGIIRNTDFQRYDAKINLDQSINHWLKAGASFNYITSKSKEVPNGGISAFYGALTGMNFNHNAYNPEADASGNYESPQGWVPNPVEAIETFKFGQEIDRMLGNFNLTATPAKGVTINYLVGVDRYTHNASGFLPIGAHSGNKTGWARSAVKTSFLINHDLNLKYRTQFSNQINSTSWLGFSLQKDHTFVLAQTSDHLSPVVNSTGAGEIVSYGETRIERIIEGAFFQQSFGYADKLFLTGAIRLDAASPFGSDAGVAMYPKVSLSYVLSEEPFWKENIGSAMNTFKVRASYGEAGNMTALGAYEKFDNYNPQPYGGVTGLEPSTRMGNANLKPERQKELEFGVDAGFLNNRLGFEFTYFNVNINDLLLERVLAPSTGFSTRFENVGTMTNKGLELLARGAIIQNKNFSWLTTVNFSKVKNSVDGIEGGILKLPKSFGISVAKNGEALGVINGYYYARNDDGSIKLDARGWPSRAQKNGVNDRKIIADPNPDWTGSLINELNYKSFSLSFQFDAVQGFDVFNFTDRVSSRPIFGGGRYDAAEIRGDLVRGYNKASYNIWERYIEDGSFIKLRELSFGYTFEPKTPAISRMRLYLTGRNLISFDNYSGWDPEVSTSGQTNGVRGFDFNEVPIPKTIQIGLKMDL
ncbi:MAG TPA: SusC/RagA family TonB-linked outer membrane protein [Saprospiraceae bacterium]|nr:SusC/RagA family TonB-linked outer membrane protein [Saprospiraceae bacterium]